MNSSEHVIDIEFEDRPQLGFEIMKVFEKHSIDKSNLEVVHKKNSMSMVIRFHCPSKIEIGRIKKELLKIRNVVSVGFLDYMPSEEKERRLQIILNSVSEGIVAIDKSGIVLHMNDMARRIFSRSHQESIDLPAEAIFPPESPIFETLKSGRTFSYMEQRIRTDAIDTHFFISCRPVRDPKGTIVGVVATIKDYGQAEEITSKVNRKKELVTFDSIIHQSHIMKQVIETAKIVSKGTSSILLRGESGTGKELFAKAIHMESNRNKHPFIAINCGALPDSLLESELFGYEPGAFTGASRSGKKGLFEQAHAGTIFLDEIGEISRQMQVRLLRVVQEQTIRRVGGEKDIPIDVRIIAATNRNLEDMMKQGLFRDDLYYRLNVIPLTIPPLRERKEDIRIIAQQLIRKICLKLGKPEKFLAKESVELLLSYHYPGNVRQLENMLELVINLEQANEIQPSHLMDKLTMQPPSAYGKDDVVASEIKIPIPIDGNWPPLKEIVREVERQIIHHIMKTAPSSRKIGNILGVSNTAILKKIKKFNETRKDAKGQGGSSEHETH